MEAEDVELFEPAFRDLLDKTGYNVNKPYAISKLLILPYEQL